MKVHTRMLSALLAMVLVFSLSVPAFAAQDGTATPDASVTGEIRATLRLDYAQNLKALQDHKVTATLNLAQENQNQREIKVDLWKIGTFDKATVTAKYREGGVMENVTEDSWPSYLDLTFIALPKGDYTLTFEGDGYKTFSQKITLGDYSQHLTLGTGDNTFSLGDLNGDKAINKADLDLLSEHLNQKEQPKFDLNGDGEVDVLDLAYVQRSVAVQGGDSDADLIDTQLLVKPTVSEAELAASGTTVSGQLSDLFEENGKGVQLTADGKKSVQLPITFEQPKEMEQIIINAPDDQTGAEKGSVLVAYEDGTTETVPFDATLPADVHAISETEGTRSITINLGKRVPVKKITITVDKTADGYTAVESIQFLKDIVPENPVAPHRMVKNLKAIAGSEKVSLKWSELPNITGYKVEYWLKENEAQKKTIPVSKPYTEIAGLENLKTYCFRVVPTAENWEGDFCAPVEAKPEPAKAPTPPEMIHITELEGALSLSWKETENATYYQVFCKKKSDPDSAYQQVGGDLLENKTTITSLENEVTYSIYLIAGNEIGKSGKSRIMEGTPKAVKYERPEGLPEAALLDPGKIKSVRLGDPNNYDRNSYTADQPFNVKNITDGKYDTHWTASNWYGNEHIICEFVEPVDLQAAFWSPRLDGNYPNWLRAYSVQVWYKGEEDDAKANKNGHLLVPDPNRGGKDSNGGSGGGDVHTWPNISNRSSIPTDRFAILPFDPQKDVIQISVAVEQSGYNLVSCSELMFMKYDPEHCLPDDISNLFDTQDGLHTQLVAGVTPEKINALKDRLNSEEKLYYYNLSTMADELALAEELLNNKPSGKSVIINGIQSRGTGPDGQKYGQGGSDLQPLGVTATAGQEMTIYVSGIPEGQTVTLYATQFNAEVSAWKQQICQLQNGRNIFSPPRIGSQNTQRGGSLYLTYNGPTPENIKLHVRRGTDIPVLELSDWYHLDETKRKAVITDYLTELDHYVTTNGLKGTTSVLNVTEISTPVVLLSLPADTVKNNLGGTMEARVQTVYDSIETWEDLMHICKTTQGIDNTYSNNDMQSRQNIRCMQMFTGAFMYAAGNHIGIGYGSCAGMVHGRPISKMAENATANNLFGWGIAHEVGHNMDKLGKAEITNNIYSIMVQTYDGKNNTLDSRLEKSGKYASAFTKVAQAYPGTSNDVFVQLAMYWQLHLAYDEGQTTGGSDKDGPMNFYNKFFKAWKAGTYTKDFADASYDEKVALTTSGVAQKNLTEFFTRWGMTLSDSVKTKLRTYPAEDRAIWYLNDKSRRDRLDDVASVTDTISATAAKKAKSDTEIEVTITQPTNPKTQVQGYEIRRNGKTIDFVIPNNQNLTADGKVVYTDEIGSGNHLTFHYKVVAYDTLGKVIGEAEAGEARIAYDKTVAADAYELTREGTTVTFTLKEETAVSGLKLTGANRPTSGNFTVTIKADGQGAEFVTARQSSFDQNQAVDDQNSFLTYFNKPGTDSTDTRIWTYDAKTVEVTGIPAEMADSEIQLVSYAGDDVGFYESEHGFIGRLKEDYKYGDSANEVIKAGTLVIVGTYRGDPVYNTLRVWGRFTETKVGLAEDGTETVISKDIDRPMDGEALMFAEIPTDGQVSDISDGLFIFIPNIQKEAELQEVAHCDGINLLPSQIKVELYRTDNPNNADSKRKTAETLWVHSPGGTDLPTITLTTEEAGK